MCYSRGAKIIRAKNVMGINAPVKHDARLVRFLPLHDKHLARVTRGVLVLVSYTTLLPFAILFITFYIDLSYFPFIRLYR